MTADVLSIPGMPLGPLGPDLAQAAGGQRPADKRAIDSVANGFESMFVSLLVKQMRQTLEPGTMFSQDNSDILGGLFDFYMGQHLAQAGSCGIAAMVKHQLTQTRSR